MGFGETDGGRKEGRESPPVKKNRLSLLTKTRFSFILPQTFEAKRKCRFLLPLGKRRRRQKKGLLISPGSRRTLDVGDVTVSSALVAEVGNGLRKRRREGSDRKVSGPNGESEGKSRARTTKHGGGGSTEEGRDREKRRPFRCPEKKVGSPLSPPLRPLERERPPRLPVSSFSSAQFLTLMLSALPRLPSFLPWSEMGNKPAGKEFVKHLVLW